jgi:cyclopropane-fatty-acyl-phospholipid synthase
MLYKFKSKATGDLIMLEPQGKHILKLIGKEPGAKGIILPSEMMAAIDALKAAVEKEELAIKAAKDAAQQAAQTDGHAEAPVRTADSARTISLRQRVVPFVDMLRRAHAEDKEVVWGV